MDENSQVQRDIICVQVQNVADQVRNGTCVEHEDAMLGSRISLI